MNLNDCKSSDCKSSCPALQLNSKHMAKMAMLWTRAISPEATIEAYRSERHEQADDTLPQQPRVQTKAMQNTYACPREDCSYVSIAEVGNLLPISPPPPHPTNVGW